MQSREAQIKGCELDTCGFPSVPRMGMLMSIDLDALYALIYIQMLIKKHLTLNDFYQRFVGQMVQAGCIIQAADLNLDEIKEYRVLSKKNTMELLKI